MSTITRVLQMTNLWHKQSQRKDLSELATLKGLKLTDNIQCESNSQ